MKSYPRLRLLAATVLFAEFAIGLGGVLTPQKEVFPFASWFLFSLVPDRVVSYDLLLRGSPDQPLDPPVPFNRAGGRVKSPHSVTVYQLIQQFGYVEEAGDGAKSDRLRRQIESHFTRLPMRYELVKRAYTPAERWKTPDDGAGPASLVKSFTAGDASAAP